MSKSFWYDTKDSFLSISWFLMKCMVSICADCAQPVQDHTADLYLCPTEDAGIQWACSLPSMDLRAHCSMLLRL